MFNIILQTTAEFERRIAEMRDYELSSFSVAAYLAYDAIWTLVMGIDRYLCNVHECMPRLFNMDCNQLYMQGSTDYRDRFDEL